MDKPIGDILRLEVTDPKIQEQWVRQLRTAEAIVQRYAAGLDTVLLADEVGMGKTYVAMAVIAHQVFQTLENDRKVLLVVPPNNILARKWEQDLRSFNQHYVLDAAAGRTGPGQGKNLRHLAINSFWEMVQNCHDYDNEDPYINDTLVRCIQIAFGEWAQARFRKKQSKWKAVSGLEKYAPEYLDFQSTYSKRAFFDFLDDRYAAGQSGIDSLFAKLRKGEDTAPELKRLFRDFARKQDSFEANVFVIGMAALRKKYMDSEESRLFNSYITALCLVGKHTETRIDILKGLEQKFLIRKEAGQHWSTYDDWIKRLGKINLWGLERETRAVLEEFRSEIDLDVDNGKPYVFFKKVQDQVIARKLADSKIGLSVIDEVHNWKNGSNGAEDYQLRFAPAIGKKLLLSATPFQIEEDELKRVFSFASGKPFGNSMQVVSGILGDSGPAKACLNASAFFRKAWERLDAGDLATLQAALAGKEHIDSGLLGLLLQQVPGSEALEAFLREALRYHGAIQDLQTGLRKIVIRHTKDRKKRHFHAGQEFTTQGRPDYAKSRQALYETPGYGKPENALINFLAMRVDQIVRRDEKQEGRQPRAHLLGGITSSNAAFNESNHALLKGKHSLSPHTQRRMRFFQTTMAEHTHPKVQATVERALENYLRGHKTLTFCERLATLHELRKNIKDSLDRAVFQTPTQDQAKAIRKRWLALHLNVELFWHASYLATLGESQGAALRSTLRADWTRIRERANRTAAELGIAPNERQGHKLLDLAILAFLIDQGCPASKSLRAMATLLQLDIAGNPEALRLYLRIMLEKETDEIDGSGDEGADAESENSAYPFFRLSHENIWFVSQDQAEFHGQLQKLLDSEAARIEAEKGDGSPSVYARILLDLPQGLRKVLIRTDMVPRYQHIPETGFGTLAQALSRQPAALIFDAYADLQTPWDRTHRFLRSLNEAEGSLNRKATRSSKRQGLWKGVFLGEESILDTIHGGTSLEKRVNLCAAFNSPLAPDILICTAIGSEGIDLHRHCADVIHHDLPWNPAKLEQRTGRVDRVGSHVETLDDLKRMRLNIGIPFLAHNYEKFQYELLLSRAQKFEILLGKPEFPVDVDTEDVVDEEGEVTGLRVDGDGEPEGQGAECLHLPEALVRYLRMDLSVIH